eukprot:5065387-Prymnesium_polylepis.1
MCRRGSSALRSHAPGHFLKCGTRSFAARAMRCWQKDLGLRLMRLHRTPFCRSSGGRRCSVRALRFAASLGFRLHASFWLAVRFVKAEDLRRVSSSRKLGELRKLARSRARLLDFFLLAFRGEEVRRTYRMANCRSPADVLLAPRSPQGIAPGGEVTFGPRFYRFLFGEEQPTVSVASFKVDKAQAAISTLPTGLELDITLGAVLAATLLSCEVGCAGNTSVEDDIEQGGIPCGPDLNAAAGALSVTHREVERACGEISATALVRAGAVDPLLVALRLLLPLETQHVHMLFASAASPPEVTSDESIFSLPGTWGLGSQPTAVQRAAGWGRERGQDARSLRQKAGDFASLVRLWELLKLDPTLSQRQLQVGPQFVLALVRAAGAPQLAEHLESQLSALVEVEGPTLRGSAVAGLAGVPPRRRGAMHQCWRLMSSWSATSVTVAKDSSRVLSPRGQTMMHDAWGGLVEARERIRIGSDRCGDEYPPVVCPLGVGGLTQDRTLLRVKIDLLHGLLIAALHGFSSAGGHSYELPREFSTRKSCAVPVGLDGPASTAGTVTQDVPQA